MSGNQVVFLEELSKGLCECSTGENADLEAVLASTRSKFHFHT